MSAQPVIPWIVEQYAVDAPFLWILRDRASRAPHYVAGELVALDRRIEAHIDGLRVAGEHGARAAMEEFERHGEQGEAFVMAVLTLERENTRDFVEFVEKALETPEALRGIVSATGWVASEHLTGKVDGLLDHGDASLRALGVAALSVRRVDARERLKDLIADASPVSARALRLAGELGRTDLADHVLEHCEEGGSEQRFWAAWSATRLGDRRRALGHLASYAGPTSTGWRAFEMTIRAMERPEATAWLKQHFAGDIRVLVAASGIMGDPSHLSWLLQQLEDPSCTRLAGESISRITGIDFDKEGLTGSEGDAETEGEGARSDGWDVWFEEWVSDLPIPDLKRLRARAGTWKPGGGGRSLIAGKPATQDHLKDVFREGSQRLRRLAALEAALLSPNKVYSNAAARLLRPASNVPRSSG